MLTFVLKANNARIAAGLLSQAPLVERFRSFSLSNRTTESGAKSIAYDPEPKGGLLPDSSSRARYELSNMVISAQEAKTLSE